MASQRRERGHNVRVPPSCHAQVSHTSPAIPHPPFNQFPATPPRRANQNTCCNNPLKKKTLMMMFVFLLFLKISPVPETHTHAVTGTPPPRPKKLNTCIYLAYIFAHTAPPCHLPHLGKLSLGHSGSLGVGSLQEHVVPLGVAHGRSLDAAGAGLGAVEVVLPLKKVRNGVVRPAPVRKSVMRVCVCVTG